MPALSQASFENTHSGPRCVAQPPPGNAYSRAADSLAVLVDPLDVLIAEGRLTEISGVGEAIADKSPSFTRRALIRAS
jgi:hypothetical protein